MASCRSCGAETNMGPGVMMIICDGNEHPVSYERGRNCPHIGLDRSHFCGGLPRTNNAVERTGAGGR